MPLKIKTYFAGFLLIITFVFTAIAQDTTPAVMSSADVMRERVAKAKAYIVIKNYNAAIYELNNIKRESSDPTVHGVINVLLMNSYLEQGDYKNAQDFLNDLSKELKANKPNAAANYFAVASQVIRSAKVQFERYRSLGFNVTDRSLPTPAATDIEKIRETLEQVITQSKELGKEAKNMDNTMALLEGATTARSIFAKDDYDANRWKMEVADAREQLTNSRSTVINAVTVPPPGMENTVASTTNPPILPQTNEQSSILLPVSKETMQVEKKTPQTVINKPSNETVAKTDTVLKPVENSKEEIKKEEPKTTEQQTSNETSKESKRNRIVVGSAPKTETTTVEEKTNESQTVVEKEENPKNTGPLDVGSLIGYATKKTSPVYPSVARNMRMTGVVKVAVIVDEEGKVSEVQNTDGPTLLQSAAQDAVRKWKFKPFTRDGEPVRATGFVSFNFSL